MQAGHLNVPQDMAFLPKLRHWGWLCWSQLVHLSILPLVPWQMVHPMGVGRKKEGGVSYWADLITSMVCGIGPVVFPELGSRKILAPLG